LAAWAQQSLKKIRSDLYLLVTELVVRHFTMTTSSSGGMSLRVIRRVSEH
jgi:hypothetical protein